MHDAFLVIAQVLVRATCLWTIKAQWQARDLLELNSRIKKKIQVQLGEWVEEYNKKHWAQWQRPRDWSVISWQPPITIEKNV